jgi:hypothetical protein
MRPTCPTTCKEESVGHWARWDGQKTGQATNLAVADHVSVVGVAPVLDENRLFHAGSSRAHLDDRPVSRHPREGRTLVEDLRKQGESKEEGTSCYATLH